MAQAVWDCLGHKSRRRNVSAFMWQEASSDPAIPPAFSLMAARLAHGDYDATRHHFVLRLASGTRRHWKTESLIQADRLVGGD